MEIRSVTGFIDVAWPLHEIDLVRFIRLIDKVTTDLENEGHHVQSKRLATQPFSRVVDVRSPSMCINFAKTLEQVIQDAGISYLALGPVDEATDIEGYHRIVDILSETNGTFLSTSVASISRGIDNNRIRKAAEVIKEVSAIQPDGFKNLFLTALANVKPFSPFLPSAYHGGGGKKIALAIENAGLSINTIRTATSLPMAKDAITSTIEASSMVLEKVVKNSLLTHEDVQFAGFDFSYAPYPNDARSIGTLLECLCGEQFGGYGSLFAAAVLTDALDSAKFHRTGFNGLMLAVLEDNVLAKRVANGSLTISELLAYSAVCGTGLDLIALPGEVSIDTLSGILLDVSALALRSKKQLTARIMPLPGKKSGDLITFDFEYFAPSTVLTPGEPLRAGLFGPDQVISLHPHL